MSAESIRQAELIDQLHASRWFSGIDASLWHEQASGLAEEKLAVGDVLFRQGDPGDAFYLVMKGHLRVALFTGEGSETVLNEVGANELIGEIQVLTGGNRTATVYASTDTTVIRIDAYVFDAITRQSPNCYVPLIFTG